MLLFVRGVKLAVRALSFAMGILPLAPAAGLADETPEVVRLAATMKPGAWAELTTEGYDQATLMRGDDILAYSGRAAWDSNSQQVLFIGQVHLKGPPVFITYSVKENAWTRMSTPPWAESLKWFHAYENNAADSTRGVFYHHSSNSGLVHKYVVSTKQWTTLKALEAPTGHGTALEYFPEMKGLVRVLNGDVSFWSEEKEAWTTLATNLEMGPYHNFSAYSEANRAVLFGGGNGSKAVYVLDGVGKIKAGKEAPVNLGTGMSLNVTEPVTGRLLVLAKGGRSLAYDPERDHWDELSSEGMPFPKYAGHSVSAASMGKLGVVLYFSSRPQGMKTYLYKFAAP